MRDLDKFGGFDIVNAMKQFIELGEAALRAKLFTKVFIEGFFMLSLAFFSNPDFIKAILM